MPLKNLRAPFVHRANVGQDRQRGLACVSYAGAMPAPTTRASAATAYRSVQCRAASVVTGNSTAPRPPDSATQARPSFSTSINALAPSATSAAAGGRLPSITTLNVASIVAPTGGARQQRELHRTRPLTRSTASNSVSASTATGQARPTNQRSGKRHGHQQSNRRPGRCRQHRSARRVDHRKSPVVLLRRQEPCDNGRHASNPGLLPAQEHMCLFCQNLTVALRSLR